VKLFHFSEEAGLARFEPRPVRIPVARGAKREWLNGPLVWAIDEGHEALYLFPRECPRILIWATTATKPEDRAQWLGDATMVAFVERDWMGRFESGVIWRYHLPEMTFEDLGDAGMWVSRTAVAPLAAGLLTDLPGELARRAVAVRPVSSLAPLRQLWDTSLHASGLRLRNAASWPTLPARKGIESDGL
jgi:hypothetical protein